MKTIIRASDTDDLDFLERLEKSCFPEFQQSSRNKIKYSLTSPFQKVLIAEIHEDNKKKAVGSITLYLYPKTIRIYSIAIMREFQHRGIGKRLLEHVLGMCLNLKSERISLETRKSDTKLIKFYEEFGFKKMKELKNYYARKEDGIRMFSLEGRGEKKSISNIIVVRP